MFNLTIDGRLVRDPKMTVTATGRTRTWFTIAHDFGYKGDEGKWITTSTLFLEVTCWGKLAEYVDRSVRKGDLVIVDARDIEVKQNGEYVNTTATASNVALSLRTDGATSERATATSEPQREPAEIRENAWEALEPEAVPF